MCILRGNYKSNWITIPPRLPERNTAAFIAEKMGGLSYLSFLRDLLKKVSVWAGTPWCDEVWTDLAFNVDFAGTSICIELREEIVTCLEITINFSIPIFELDFVFAPLFLNCLEWNIDYEIFAIAIWVLSPSVFQYEDVTKEDWGLIEEKISKIIRASCW